MTTLTVVLLAALETGRSDDHGFTLRGTDGRRPPSVDDDPDHSDETRATP